MPAGLRVRQSVLLQFCFIAQLSPEMCPSPGHSPQSRSMLLRMLLEPPNSSLEPILPLAETKGLALVTSTQSWLSPANYIPGFFKMWIGIAHSHLSSSMVSDCFSKASCNCPLSPQLLLAVALGVACFPATFLRTTQFNWLSTPLSLHHYSKISFQLDQRPDSTSEAPEDATSSAEFARVSIRSALKLLNTSSLCPKCIKHKFFASFERVSQRIWTLADPWAMLHLLSCFYIGT